MWGALIGAGASLLGGALASSGAKKAAKAQSAADQAAIAEQRRQYDTSREDLAPYRQVGTGALNQLASLYGLPQYAGAPPMAAPPPAAPTGFSAAVTNLLGPQSNALAAPQAPVAQPPAPQGTGMAGFFASPDYQFNLEQGQQAIDRSAAARGGLLSGRAVKEGTRFASGLASGEFGNYFNRLANLAGIGQTATTAGAQLGANMAGNVGNLLSNSGAARASGYANSANAWGAALGGAGGLAYDYFSNTRLPSYSPMSHNFTGFGSTRAV